VSLKGLLQITLALSLLGAAAAKGEAIDPVVNVGSYNLHFHIVKGTGTPILFESGGGDDATVWLNILPALADITHATLITYDRSGFGKSGLDPKHYGIVNGVAGLEQGLQSLGYEGDVILVAHSFGGFYSTLYASRHPKTVKAVVLIDANVACFYTPERLAATQKSNDEAMPKLKDTKPGLYYQSGDFSRSVEVLRKTTFPSHIPVIDIVSEKTPFSESADIQDWKRCHQEFDNVGAHRQGIVAYASGHYVFEENPALTINAIVKAYIGTLSDEQRLPVLKRSLSYNLDAANQAKKQQADYSHSEDDLNNWGYTLIKQGEKQKAVEVLKLNVQMHPGSANVYDSLAECYEGLGNKAQAITNYQHSLTLNPSNEHATERLRALQGSN
jgi:pimeloyl-ACP methyl ester carboxylesterase